MATSTVDASERSHGTRPGGKEEEKTVTESEIDRLDEPIIDPRQREFLESAAAERQYWLQQMESGRTEEVWRAYTIDKEAKSKFVKDVFKKKLKFFLSFPVMWPFMPCLCFEYTRNAKNIEDLVNAEHVAIGREGILHHLEQHKAGYRCRCHDVPAASKTVPFDRIQDVQVREPAGSAHVICCLTVPRVSYIVHVQTAAMGGSRPEVRLYGLMDPYGFRRTVLALKRKEGLPPELGPGTIHVPNVDMTGASLQTTATPPTRMQTQNGFTSSEAHGMPPSMSLPTGIPGLGVGADRSEQVVSVLEAQNQVLMSIDASLKQQQQQQQQQQRSLA